MKSKIFSEILSEVTPEIESKVEQKTLEMMKPNKENIFINLSKLSEEQIKTLPQILEKVGQEIYFLAKPTLLSGKFDMYYPYLLFSRPSSNVWVFSHNKPDRTELTYPNFIKLFEGWDGETSLQIALKALEDIVNPIGYMKSQLKDGESLDGHYAIMIADKPKFYQDIAKEALEKINSK